VLYGARDSPHGNLAGRIWAALKNYMASSAVSWPGRRRQIRVFSRNRSPGQMLATAAPWTSPWLPPENFWNAAGRAVWPGQRPCPDPVTVAGGWSAADRWLYGRDDLDRAVGLNQGFGVGVLLHDPSWECVAVEGTAHGDPQARRGQC
jgi:hypothetical protein